MFEDFDKAAASREGRGRMGASLLISTIMCVGIAAALAAAVATAHVVVRRRQSDVAVSFADLQRAAPPKPKMMATAKPRAAARKLAAPVVAPRGIPTERPEEAEGELAEAGSVGPVDAFVVEKAPPPVPPPAPAPKVLPPPEVAPEQRRETIEQPQFLSGCRAPEVPEALLTLAATVQIDVRMVIDAGGNVQSAKIVKAHPLIPDELILRCAREQLFKPAHLPDGTGVAFPFHRRFVFRPARA